MSDNRQLTTAEQGRSIGAQSDAPSEAQRMLAMIHDAATNPDVDAQKMVTLADLAIKLQDRERETEFRRAKVAALLEMPSIGRRGEIKNNAGKVQSRYSKFEDIHKAVVPILARHKLVINFEVGQHGNQITVRPVLTHANGYEEKGDAMPLTIDTTGSKNATQGAGSAASYGKRHSIKAALNIVEVDEDDDGRAAGGGSADPRDRWTPAQRELVEDGMAAAARGLESYSTWYQSRTPAERGWLVFEGQHDELKKMAGN